LDRSKVFILIAEDKYESHGLMKLLKNIVDQDILAVKGE